ncbi:MAG TPA: trehalase family glycosidase, partial [Deinococcales bacterium]|nr:trehalase family glycosidase [Deinococcales bacterium]
PRLRDFQAWLRRHRDPQGRGIVMNLHPWETGADNSAAWDAALAAVPVADLPPYQRRDTGHVDASQRPLQHEYDRYLSLVVGFRERQYRPDKIYQWSPFRVADPGFNAINARANADLAWLARRLAIGDAEPAAWAEEGRAGLQRLWDDEAGWFLPYDDHARRKVPVRVSAGAVPLFARAASQEQADRIARRLERWGEIVRYLVPSTDPESPAFEPKRYWRGPVWAIVNWMIVEGLRAYGHDGLADRVKADTLELLENTGFAEYYHPLTGEGLGGWTFSWTAAIYLDWTAGVGESRRAGTVPG